MVIAQGDVFWVEFGRPAGAGPGYRHPAVVVQNDAFNRSPIGTVVICPLTSNLSRAAAPGNIRLRKGEAKLPRPSVVNVSQITSVDKSVLVERIGVLSKSRVREILDGIALLLVPTA